MLSYQDAVDRILALSPRLPAERVGIDQACGRVLFESVVAPADMPGFDYSAMDGYAVSCSSWPETGVVHLPVRGESRAGGERFALSTGIACRIFTGAPIPEGADAVVMQEQVERSGDMAIFTHHPKAGAHIRRRGEDLAAGAVALMPGTRLRPSHIALAASCDRAWLECARAPVVTFLGTGDELRSPGAPGRPGQIPESNTVALQAMARGACAHSRVLGAARDEGDILTRALESALPASDLLVTIGGVSVGDHDLVRPALEALGATIEFWKVAIKPGKPLLVGRRGDTLVLGLPGNPASAIVTFALFGLPLLRTMQGDLHPRTHPMSGICETEIPHVPGRTEFVRVAVTRENTELRVRPIPNQASGASTSMARADALACVEQDRGPVLAGERVDVLFLDELGA
jgi:molybdopterin molybdotransferase